MKCKALETIRSHGMLQSGHVLAAVSGGIDSMSLLHLLVSLRQEFGYTLEAAHVHHGLRGVEADRDERFVRQTCEAWGVPLHVLHADVAAEAERTGESLEACGRRVRYAYFTSVARGEIATAHTLDDNAETVLLHLARGSGLRGLCGIPPVRGNVIRPLLACTRADVVEYAAAHGIDFVTDSTNASDAFARNRVRHTVLPPLQTINPAVSEAIVRCARTLTRDEDYLDAQTRTLLQAAKRRFGYDARTLQSAHPALRYRAIGSLLRAFMREDPQTHHVEQCVRLLDTGGAVQTERDATVCVYGGLLYLRQPLRAPWSAQITGDAAVLPFGRIEIQRLSAENIQNIHKDLLPNCLCCDTIASDVFFRSRREGDRMKRVGASGSKSMKKLMEEQGIPACRRNDVPILTDGERVLWAEGIGCDAQLALTPQSRSGWMIRVIREDES